ncbi:MAG: thiamine-phosphate kinase [Candidatus Omnitrophota bacterium]|jgi:thiamine-monophosphate kinase
MKTLSDIGEFGFIERIKRMLPADSSVLTPAGDDTAVVKSPGRGARILMTTDMLVEGVHFKPGTSPELIGRKALACNISDIAAMGGVPRHALVSVAIPPRTGVSALVKFYKGLAGCAREFRVNIVGGDTVKSRCLAVNVALTGEARPKDVVLRRGAAPGDEIFVTGPLGRAWKSGKDLRFKPRVEEARFLILNGLKPSAMIDISDGLAADLGHILAESGCSACLGESEIPLARGASLKEALYDGEDYELLLTLSKQKAARLRKADPQARRFVPIGVIQSGSPAVYLKGRNGRIREIARKGFTHF